jgi:hypothetical protein
MIGQDMDAPAAETLALQAFAFIAGDDRLLDAFLSRTGADPASLRAQVSNPVFLGAVLDHVLGDENLLLSLCAALDVPPQAPLQARQSLPGSSRDAV